MAPRSWKITTSGEEKKKKKALLKKVIIEKPEKTFYKQKNAYCSLC